MPQHAAGPQPQPSYFERAPGAWDVTEPDEKLTGMYPEMRVGDMNHLYLNYQDCREGPCVRMLAATTDRGRTWNKQPMPVITEKNRTATQVVQAHGSFVLAMSAFRPENGEWEGKLLDPIYFTSVDAGVTWTRAAPRPADVVPTGWLISPAEDGVVGVDPATGEVVRVPADEKWRPRFRIETPAGSGIWEIDSAPMDRMIARVSQDGKTWEERELPTDFSRPDGGHPAFGGALTDQIRSCVRGAC